ncbi:MAG: GGDEF domain-containing protein [Gammaproteobacteria bacterium]
MDRSLIRRLMTPGGVPRFFVFSVSVIAIFVICLIDIHDGSDIRLRLLYIFPLAAIALHSTRVYPALVGVALTIVCEFATLLSYAFPESEKLSEAFIGTSGYLLVVFLARIARKNYLEAMRQATHDPLTELRNRRSFESITELEISRRKRYGGVFSLAVMDLDNFKQLNDSKGHRAGDQALILVADILREHTRNSDSTARLGGDEFAILMPDTLKADCASLCQKLSANIAVRMAAAGFATTASIGFTTFGQAPDSTSEALHKADLAMYVAKTANKGSAVSL